MMLWTMSDRAIPRSYRMMEGFGVHTFRLVNARGETILAKFHWKPVLGVHGLVWEEAQMLGGVDPDFHRRDLWDAIDGGAFPQWELGLQLLPDTEDQTFEGIDLLDATKIVPEELAPVRRVGTLTLDRNPTNFFAETEQVAFHAGHVVRGIDVTDDPLLHARLFSYLDTQLIRLGGPNFAQLPINRPAAPVNNHQRDGYGQQAIHEGRAPYSPNSIDAAPPRAAAMDATGASGLLNRDGTGDPGPTGDDERAAGGYVHVPRRVDGPKVRQRAQSFTDHYTQATLFWNSMTPVERDHIVGAFSFELSKVADQAVVARMLGRLAQVDAELTERVAAALGVPAPAGSPAPDVAASPALSMALTAPGPITGRVVGVLAGPGVDVAGLEALEAALAAEGALLHVIAPRAGVVEGAVVADRTVYNAKSVEFDAVIVAGGASAPVLAADPTTGVFLQEAYRHHKTVAAWGEGVDVLATFSVPTDARGVVTSAEGGRDFAVEVAATMGWHRHWDRPAVGPKA
jgi:catalase